MQTDFRARPASRLLDSAQLELLHARSLEILETIGVKVMEESALKLLRNAGCRVMEGDIVRIPPAVVEKSLQQAPSEVVIYDRLGNAAMRLAERHVYFGMGTDLLHTLDLESGQMRPSLLQDVRRAVITADACENIDFVASHAFPSDVPGNAAFVASFKAMLENTSKPIYFTSAGEEDLAWILEMAAAVRGSEKALREKPFLIHYAEPTSPLVHSPGALRKLLLCADKGIPLNYVPSLLCGASGPVTLAGALCVANAEALSGLVIQQLRAPGAPMISGFNVTPLDMWKGTAAYGSPEERLAQTSCAQLYRSYGLPVWATAGCSDAKLPDEQAAFEYGISLLFSALDGCNLVHDVGYLGQGLVGSLQSIVMGDEMIGYVRRILKGFSLSEEAFALEVVRAVGPGGDFLSARHTLENFKHELWRPTNMDRNSLEQWQKGGAARYGERLRQRAGQILEIHTSTPLGEESRRELEGIWHKACGALEKVRFKV